MKKRIFSVLIAVVMLLLCGCTRLSMEKNLPGTWRSEDGYTVSFENSVITVYDTDGHIVEGFPASYYVSENILYLVAGDTVIDAFECRADGDSLTLIYTDRFLLQTIGTAEKRVSISLERCDED